MIISLQSQHLDRYLWLTQGKDGLSYPQIDAGPVPASPDDPVYINTPFPPINEILSRQLWTEASGALPIRGNYEPVQRTPDAPVYVKVPYPAINDLPGAGDPRTTFDGVSAAGWLWKPPKKQSSRVYPAAMPRSLPITMPY